MKFLTVAVVLALVAVAAAQDQPKLSEELKQKVHTLAAECIKETGASEEVVRAADKGDYSKVDGKVKCFTKCLHGKLGFVENGKVNEANVQSSLGKIFGDEQVKAIQAKCNSIKGADDCDTSFELHKCYSAEHAAFLA